MRRIVVKVGTSTLTYPTGLINIRHLERLCRVLADLRNAGNEILLVSSGAVGVGMGILGLPERPRELLTLHYFGGLPLARVGELAGLSPGAAKTALCRARQRLRQIMEEDGYEV